MREVLGDFLAGSHCCPKLPRRGCVSLCSVRSGVAGAMEGRNVETWIFSTIFSVCVCVRVRAFPHLGNWEMSVGQSPGAVGSAGLRRLWGQRV